MHGSSAQRATRIIVIGTYQCDGERVERNVTLNEVAIVNVLIQTSKHHDQHDVAKNISTRWGRKE